MNECSLEFKLWYTHLLREVTGPRTSTAGLVRKSIANDTQTYSSNQMAYFDMMSLHVLRGVPVESVHYVHIGIKFVDDWVHALQGQM